jgi:hypothetical protein
MVEEEKNETSMTNNNGKVTVRWEMCESQKNRGCA